MRSTRCRTGCLPCRTRRRKCDEAKPHCQNCIGKNLDCQYGLQVSFLPKNMHTVAAEELPAPAPAPMTDGKHNKFHFVNENPRMSSDAPADSPSSTAIMSADSSVDGTLPLRDGNNVTTESQHSQDLNGKDANEDLSRETPTPAPWSDDNQESERHLQPAAPGLRSEDSTFSDQDEFAIHGLLTLGTSDIRHDVPTTVSPPVIHSSVTLPSTISRRPLGTRDLSASGKHSSNLDEEHTTPTSKTLSSTLADANILPADSGLELLRHYRYSVAPWLDICDLRQPFGTTVLQMAMGSDRIHSAIMRLSDACLMERNKSVPTVPANNAAHQPNLYSTSTEEALSFVLEEVRSFVTNASETWKNTERGDLTLFRSLAKHAFSDNIISTIYWMSLRLDLSSALANSTPNRVPLPMEPIPDLSLLCRSENTYERVRHYAHTILWLCGKALKLYHLDIIPQPSSASHVLVQDWLQAFEEVAHWYQLRPQEFRPVVEIDKNDVNSSPEGEFPMLLFTNGTGSLCNQLYHTTMLILLQCKPRTILLGNLHSLALSPLWHAQCICGIAINNDRRECWDPCLLASFLVAARHMTHVSQQREILQGYYRIRRITGWDIGEYLTQLHEYWAFLEGN